MPSYVRSLRHRPISLNSGYYTRIAKVLRRKGIRRRSTAKNNPIEANLLYRHRHIVQRRGPYGMGSYASKFIPEGTIIIREKPYVLDVNLEDSVLSLGTSYLQDRCRHIKQLLSDHTTSHKFIDMVPTEIDIEDPHVISYESIRNYHQTYLPDLTRYEMILYYMKHKRNAFQFGDQCGILFYSTRMNHSCNPNVSYYKKDDHMIFQTKRDIPANTEIFGSYINPNLSTDERQRVLLERYGFVCACDKCQNDINLTIQNNT